MSTDFYRLKPPFTSVRTWPRGESTGLSIWINHAKAGEIFVRNEELKDVLLALVRNDPAVNRRGIGNGETALRFEDDDVEDDTPLISEYGELTCLAELHGEQPEPDTCCECNELAVGYSEGSPYCAAHYRSRPSICTTDIGDGSTVYDDRPRFESRELTPEQHTEERIKNVANDNSQYEDNDDEVYG